MLLRSSSTPILGSLLSSSSSSLHFSDSPTATAHHHHSNPPPQSISRHFAPTSDSSDRDPPSSGFRRTRSDGNLHNLLSDQPDDPHHHLQSSVRCSSSRLAKRTTLETIPSFAIYNSIGVEEEGEQQQQMNPVTVGGVMQTEFSFPGDIQDMGLDENDGREIGMGRAMGAPPLFLARGLGIDRLGSGLFGAGGHMGGGSGGHHTVLTDNSGGGQSDLEMYYKSLVEEDPTNALFLCNYAQFLYQTKGDLQRAEEYYSRAILAEPGDGDILSQYAKLTWELHRDEERASCYFEQSVQAAPQDSNVLGAYAGFLWETEDDEGEGGQACADAELSVHHGPFGTQTELTLSS